MLLSFDIKFTRHDQIQCRNGGTCQSNQSNVFLVESDKLDIKDPIARAT